MTEAIVPDGKDWTWVLHERCPECGFDAEALAPTDFAAITRDVSRRMAEALGADDPLVAVRSDPARWSTLEYGAHVRDVMRIFRQRLHLMLETDDPLFANWDQDATAVDERYGEQDPATVAADLVEAADRLADAFELVHGDQWQRPGRRSDGAVFTIESFARYFVHDPIHHLWDIGRPYPA